MCIPVGGRKGVCEGFFLVWMGVLVRDGMGWGECGVKREGEGGCVLRVCMCTKGRGLGD